MQAGLNSGTFSDATCFDWSEYDSVNLREARDSADVSPKRTRRRRGTHSTACKCAAPKYLRPATFSQLPKVLREGYHRAQKRRFSRHPYFVHMRPNAGRERDFRQERQHLLDAMAVLLVSGCDIATFNVALNSSQICKALSPKDSRGEVIPGEEVTPSRICRALDLLENYGLIEPYMRRLDPYTKTYLPRHVTLTEQFFKLLQVNLDLLYKERDERLLAMAEGILAPGEVMSVKAARQRFSDEKVAQALKVRRERATEQKRLSRIARSTRLDDRQFQIAAWLINTRPEVSGMTPDDFELLVYHYLRQIKLNFDAEPPG